MTQATPKQYASVFGIGSDAEAVLDDLTTRFAGPLWSADADERTRRIGQREVIEHIHSMISQADTQPRR